MKALLLVRHGPELRLLGALSEIGDYAEIIPFVDSHIASEVRATLGNAHAAVVFQPTNPSPKLRLANYLSALADSIARRINRSRGIGHFSYAKRQHKTSIPQDQCSAGTPTPLTLSAVGTLITVLGWLASGLYRDTRLISLLKHSGCGIVLICDHLGGTDAVACNARHAGLKVRYYLNNHKDLTIRPYVPPVADALYSWFASQTNVVLDVCGSHRKMLPIGLLRANTLLASVNGSVQKSVAGDCSILHCCSDPRRRPYEIVSLKEIFDLVQANALPLRFMLRLNPMDKAQAMNLLSSYPFVEVIHHGWRWDDVKFLNIPDKAAEADYAKQLSEADFVTALPSTSLAEAWLFGKKAICLLDTDSPDRISEENDMKLSLPLEVISGRSFKAVKSPEQYLEVIMEARIHG